MKLLNSTKYEYNYLDNITGEAVTYTQVTRWDDSTTITESLCDGVLYRKIGDLYYKRVSDKPLNVLSFGLKNDGTTRNELKLAKVLEKLPPKSELYFPAGTYLFGPLPPKYNLGNNPVAINISSSGVNLIGESRDKTILKFLPGCVGVQVTGGLDIRPIRISDMSFTGPGAESDLEGKVINNAANRPDGSANPDVGRVIGEASLDPANYQFNGINLWGQGHLNNVNMSNFSGHNLCIFGSPSIYLPGIPFDIAGTIIDRNNGGGFSFIYNNPAEGAKVRNGYSIVVGNSSPDLVRGTYETGFDGQFVTGIVAGPAVVTFTPRGGSLIADNSTITGLCNFDFAGGCGLFITGPDGNQLTMFGGSFRENGLWGVDEGSFLGSFFYGTHFSANGRRVNRFSVDGIFGNNKLIVGPFIQRYISARSGFFGCYAEEGNQGPAIVGPSCGVTDGIIASGISGGYRREGNSIPTGFGVGNYNYLPIGIEVNHRDKPNIALTGTFTSTTSTGSEEVLFVPTNMSELSKVTAGLKFSVYLFSLTITSVIPGQGITLGPLQDSLPPRAPTNEATTGFVIVPQPVRRPGLVYHEFATGNIGFSIGNAQLGQGESELLTFTDNAVSINNLLLANTQRTSATSIDSYIASINSFGNSVNPGTEILIVNAVNKPTSYLCYRGGTYGDLDSTGITVNQNGPTLRMNIPFNILQAGQYVIVNGKTYLITSKDTAQDYYVLPQPSGIDNNTIEYSPPAFQPIGFGEGSLSIRPNDLGIHDRGWQWLADDNTRTTWTGTTWI